VQSGCPTALINIVKEANRRYLNGEINQADYYNNYSLLSCINNKSINIDTKYSLDKSDNVNNIFIKQYASIVAEELL
jgi:hypothetical protein